MTNRTFKSVIWLAAGIALAACSSDEMMQPGDAGRTPITMTTTIAKTRGVQDQQLVNGQKVYVWAHEMQKPASTWVTDWTAGAHINAWELTAQGDGTFTGAARYYPEDPLTMMAVHGRSLSLTAGTTTIPATVSHTVASDQSAAADLAESDLIFWASDNSGSGYTATASAIAMQMTHKLSKIEVTLDPTGSDYTAAELAKAVVTIAGVRPTITMNMATATSGALGTASGSATITPHSPSALNFEAIIPPQAKPEGVISIALNGYTIPVTPSLPAASFAENTRYQYTIALKNEQAEVTAAISPWGTPDGWSGSLGSKQVPAFDLRKNPLWYVAEYNVDYTYSAAEIANSNTFDGSGTFSFATAANAGYYFSWTDAMKNFTTSANASAPTPSFFTSYTCGSGSVLKGWHLPTVYEWNSISPTYSGGEDRTPLDELCTAGNDVIYSATTEVCFGFNATTRGDNGTYMAENSYWYRQADNIWYAIRYCDSEFCSAWKYQLSRTDPTDTSVPLQLTISSTLLGKSYSTSEAQAQFGKDDAKWATIYWGNNATYGAVQRTFYGCGIRDNYQGNGNTPDQEQDNRACYWATSDRSGLGSIWHFNLDTNNGAGFRITTSSNTSTRGYNVRLFRDSYDYAVPKTTIASATTSDLALGDIVCGNGDIYDASAVNFVNLAHKNPVAVIVSVGTTGNSTYNRALALAMNDANNGNTVSWKTSNGNYDNSVRFTSASFSAEDGLVYQSTRNNSTWPAFQAAVSNNDVPAPSGSSGWFLPSAYQWNLMLSATGGYTSLRNYFGNRGGSSPIYDGTAFYWSSTEFDLYRSWYFAFHNGYWNASSNKTYLLNVRSALAF